MNQTTWQQVNISWPGDTPQQREQHAVAHLSHVLTAAEIEGLITSWWFIRKGPWRIRYQPATEPDKARLASEMITSGHSWTTDIYEPETHAFGGTKAMASAHALFRHDSRHLLAYLRQDPGDRRERSLRLCTALMRAATLDLNEQGDVWAKVLEHRAGHFTRPQLSQARAWDDFTASTRQLLTGTARTAGQWHAAFEDAGTDLQRLREAGNLTRGLRAVIALHVIFHWNRIGLPARTQAASPGPPRKPSSAGHRADEPGLAVLTAGAWRIPLSALQPPAVTQVTSHGR